MYTLNSMISTSSTSLLLLYPQTLATIFLNFNLIPCCRTSLPYIMTFRHTINHQRNQTTRLHTSRCHHYNYCYYCNVDFVLFRTITHYTNPLLSRIYIGTTKVLNITSTSVATSMIIWS